MARERCCIETAGPDFQISQVNIFVSPGLSNHLLGMIADTASSKGPSEKDLMLDFTQHSRELSYICVRVCVSRKPK